MKRKNLKKILANPAEKKKLILEATTFIINIELGREPYWKKEISKNEQT